MGETKVEAAFILKAEGYPPIGRERIDLLEAVAAHGSITKAAKAVGLSYKAAWDSLNAINNLLPRPAVVGHAGGAGGGGARMTEDGHALVAAFREIERKLAEIAGAFAAKGAGAAETGLSWSPSMKTSARNAFRCEVAEVRRGAVNADILLRLSDQARMTAVVTLDSVDELGLVPGRAVTALVNSSFILLAKGGQPLLTSARNRLSGTVLARDEGAVNCEFTIDLGGGKTLVATVTRDGAAELDLHPGDPVQAFFKASHLILMAD